MIKLVKAHQAVTASSSVGNAHEAIDSLLDFGLDLKQAPIQARWNAPIGIIWKTNRKYLGFEWQSLAKRFPNDVLIRYNAGLAMYAIQDNEGAISHLIAAIRSMQLPESMRGETYKSLGLALMKSGRATEAEAPLRAALEQSPPDLQAYCALSEVYKQANRLDDAERAAAGCNGVVSK
jgi:tetratricopeptide (TPR) repeat protein